MIQMPYNDIVEKITEKSGLGADEIEDKVNAKLKQLSGLISKEGAAHIIANELGVKLFENVSGKLQIKNVLSGMRNVETVGKVTAVYDVREFQTEKRKGKVSSFFVADETGSIRVTCWGEQAETVKKITEGDVVKVSGGYVRENQGKPEIHMNEKSTITLNPPGETVKATVENKRERKHIKDITENDDNVELLGTLVQAFAPKFFEVCPECGKRAKPSENSFVCSTHGTVEPTYSYVMNAVLDDGTETIRTVFFKNQLERLLGKDAKEMLTYKDDYQAFEPVKNDILGSIIKIVGRAKKNEMFDRIEFTAQLVFTNPDPEEELKRLKEDSDITLEENETDTEVRKTVENVN